MYILENSINIEILLVINVGQYNPLGPDVSFEWVMVPENFEIASFFTGNHWHRSVTRFDDVTSPREALLSKENGDFSKKQRNFVFLSVFLGWSTSKSNVALPEW